MNLLLWLALAFLIASVVVPVLLGWWTTRGPSNPDDYGALVVSIVLLVVLFAIAVVLAIIGAAAKWL